MVSKRVKPTNDDAKLRKIFRIRTRTYNVMKHKNVQRVLLLLANCLYTDGCGLWRFETSHFGTFRKGE